MTTQALNALRQLKLPGMATALQTQLEQVGAYEGLAFVERLTLLVEQECTTREQRKQQRLIRQARFRLNATAQDIDYQHPRNVSRDQIARLAQGDWIERGQNLLLTGPCGSGKTYIACALGHSACLRGHSTRYYRLSRLLLELTQAKADGSYHKQLKLLAKVQLLVIDDWGTRMLSEKSPFYDPVGYNNGAVWLFLTGYSAMAEYAAGRRYSGYQHLRQVASTTWIDGRGRHPEVM